MGKRGNHRSAPPVYRYTPGIVDRGETMTVGRKSFIIPDNDPMPLGRRSLTAGRKVYSWSTAPNVSPLGSGRVTDDIPEDAEVRPTMRRVLMRDEMIVRESSVTAEDRARYGLAAAGQITYSAVWVDDDYHGRPVQENDVTVATADVDSTETAGTTADPTAVVPAQTTGEKPVKPVKPLTRREEQDAVIRQYLTAKGLPIVMITPQIRAAALDAIADQAQLADYIGAA